jgi:hypothetical protein
LGAPSLSRSDLPAAGALSRSDLVRSTLSRSDLSRSDLPAATSTVTTIRYEASESNSEVASNDESRASKQFRELVVNNLELLLN